MISKKELFEYRISYMLANMKRNFKIERILEQMLKEMWALSEEEFKWTPEPTIKIDGKWVANPEYRRVLQLQKDLLWEIMTQNAKEEQEKEDKYIFYR